MEPIEPPHIANVVNGSSNNYDTAETKFDKVYNRVFCDDDIREMVQTTEAVGPNFANSVQRAIEQLPKQPLDDFYPPIVVSYSTEHREERDAQNAGPGYVVVGCLIRCLFDNGMECYSDMMTRSRWTDEFMSRVDSDRAEVMIAVLSPRFFWSVHCLNEVCRAKEKGLKIVAVRLQKDSLKEEDRWRIEDLETYAKNEHPDNWSKEKRALEDKRLKAIKALEDAAVTIPNRGTFLSDPKALEDLKEQLRRLLHLNPRGEQLQRLLHHNPQEQHPLSSHGTTLPVASVTRRVVDDSSLKVVGYQFAKHTDCGIGKSREEVESCLEELATGLKEFLRRHNEKNTIDKHITVKPWSENGKAVQLIKFDVGYMMQDMQDIGRRCKTVERLLGELAELVGADNDVIELFQLKAVFDGSLIVLMEAPSSFFSNINGMFQASGNQIVLLENNVHVTGIAQAFVVTIPDEVWPNDLKELCSACADYDVISMKEPHFSLLVPTTKEAFTKLTSNGVNDWRNQNDEAWVSLPTVAPYHEAESKWRKEAKLCFTGDREEDEHAGVREMVQTTEPVSPNLANSVRRAIEQLPKQPLDDFYPPIIVSYSAEHLEELDTNNVGPEYVVVGHLVRFVFDNGMECYSDMMTPAGSRWAGEFVKRVDRAKVMIAVLSPRFFLSVHCLNEICIAKERGLKIIPLRLQDHSLREEDKWRIEDLERYAKIKHPNNWSEAKRALEDKRLKAIEALKGVGTVPSFGTFLSDPEALGDLKRQLQHLLHLNPKEQHQLSSHGPRLPEASVTRRVVDDSSLKVVGYKFTNYVNCDTGDNVEVETCLEELVTSIKDFLRRHNEKPIDKHITVEPWSRNGKTFQRVKFDVGYMMKEFQDIGRQCKTVERLLGKLAKMVGASDGEIELFRLMVVLGSQEGPFKQETKEAPFAKSSSSSAKGIHPPILGDIMWDMELHPMQSSMSTMEPLNRTLSPATNAETSAAPTKKKARKEDESSTFLHPEATAAPAKKKIRSRHPNPPRSDIVASMDYPVSREKRYQEHPGKLMVLRWINSVFDEYHCADVKSFRTDGHGRILRSREQILNDIIVRLRVQYGGEFKRRLEGSDAWVGMSSPDAGQTIAYRFNNVKKIQQRAAREEAIFKEETKEAPVAYKSSSSSRMSVDSSFLRETMSDMVSELSCLKEAPVANRSSSSSRMSVDSSVLRETMSDMVSELSSLQTSFSKMEPLHQMLPPASDVWASGSVVSDEIHSTVNELNDKIEDEDLVERMMCNLALVTTSVENETLLVAAGDLDTSTLEIIVEATKRYPDNDKIQGSAVWILSILVDYDDNRNQLVQRGGKELIEKLAIGMAAFGDGTRIDEGYVMEGVNKLVNDIRASEPNEQEQTYFCRAIGNLAVNYAYAEPIVDEDAMDLVLGAMRRFPFSTELQRQACRALGHLAVRDVLVAEIICLSGGVELIITAMKKFPTHGGILRFAVSALEFLGSATKGARERIESHGGVELARDAWKDEEIFFEDEKMYWRIFFPATMIDTRFILTDEFLQEN